MKVLKQRFSALLLITLSLCLFACGGGSDGGDGGTTTPDENQSDKASVTTGAYQSLTAYIVTIDGRVQTSKTITTNSIGIVIGTKKQPTLQDNSFNIRPTSVDAQGKFTITASGLKPSTQYYYRAYYYSGTEFFYGDSKSFTTPTVSIASVDLGLSSGTIWAINNLGAEYDYEIGDYFRLGEILPRDYVSAKPFANKLLDVDDDHDKIGDYEENLQKLDPATQYWGKEWSTPTRNQLDELSKECDWQWVNNYQNKNINGYIVKSKTNDRQMFMPATGYIDANGKLTKIEKGYYRSRLMTLEIPNSIDALYFYEDFKTMTVFNKEEALVIRPVMTPEK